ncbi:hypothetical protein KIL84_018653 [Mauremys mutica]|uniref:Beta/gamma crystallin 'Greek key' domain-containing protein n=1 Tax=Mauremys mutica TaxID=74926 RepID=A0A9D3XQS7_9SAUR|nr:hypothetical protein KIL84_018653 [Mauremys mutica]
MRSKGEWVEEELHMWQQQYHKTAFSVTVGESWMQRVNDIDISSLGSVGWNDCISSQKVIGQIWVAYQHHHHYSGKIRVFEEGEYSFAGHDMNDEITSFQLIMENLHNPQITLYKHPHY